MKRTGLLAGVVLILLLAGCASGQKGGEVAYYDLEAARQAPRPLPFLRTVEVVAPSWLDSGALQYRLNFDDAARRHAYSRSRWTAAPAELLEQLLKRNLLGDGTTGQCRLRLELEEFEQVFDSPTLSRGVIEARASLYVGQGRAPLARQSFALSRPAASADASGGIKSLGTTAGDLVQGLGSWLGPDLARQCQ